MKGEKLEPCPLCRSRAVLPRERKEGARPSVVCMDCGCSAPLAAWNKRATPAPPDDVVEAVARAMFEAEHAGLSNCYSWDDHWEEYQETDRPRYYTCARAALSAMPSQAEAFERARAMAAKACDAVDSPFDEHSRAPEHCAFCNGVDACEAAIRAMPNPYAQESDNG